MNVKSLRNNEIFIGAARHVLLPALFYLVCFILLTYPLILDFGNRFFAGDTDGMLHVWNLWWVERVLTHPGEFGSIWHTNMVDWPFGVSLLGHTLVPVNGFIATFLMRSMPLLEAHNVIVVFSFAASGLTAYWLAYYFSRSAWGSLAAGYIFTFSTYHFSQYLGHLNMITLEWIPLFALCFYVLVHKPNVWIGVAAAFALWLAFMSDYYYLLYCLFLGGLILLARMIETRSIFFFVKPEYAAPLGVFIPLCLILIGPVIFPLLVLNHQDPLLGGHDPVEFSLDLPSLFIPGQRWRFGELTRFYWRNLKAGAIEMNVYPGWVLIAFVVYAFRQRKKLDDIERRQIAFWFAAILFFILMALGPRLQVWGTVTHLPMLYALMERIIPFLTLSGVPVRMVMMAVLAGSVLASFSIRELMRGSVGLRLLLVLLLSLAVIETLPAPLVTTTTVTPGYVKFLADQSNDGGVLDLAAPSQFIRLYYGTVHEKPLVFGSTSRIPTSLYLKNKGIKDAIYEQNYRALWDTYRIRYVVTLETIDVYDPHVEIQLIYDEEGVKIYRLAVR